VLSIESLTERAERATTTGSWFGVGRRIWVDDVRRDSYRPRVEAAAVEAEQVRGLATT
jgi:hypothetical protein